MQTLVQTPSPPRLSPAASAAGCGSLTPTSPAFAAPLPPRPSPEQGAPRSPLGKARPCVSHRVPRSAPGSLAGQEALAGAEASRGETPNSLWYLSSPAMNQGWNPARNFLELLVYTWKAESGISLSGAPKEQSWNKLF
ncbi:translation initiation factor IF-2-like [Bubalus kerabau]|uniref:translation initiation factor IF-2-like n=1 Tax=Bubalus carabanensis TaxID=3119969 RepID=UPI00244EF906|nr:translation initiation factor IF-2-like [Bubalus carabanensis]